MDSRRQRASRARFPFLNTTPPSPLSPQTLDLIKIKLTTQLSKERAKNTNQNQKSTNQKLIVQIHVEKLSLRQSLSWICILFVSIFCGTKKRWCCLLLVVEGCGSPKTTRASTKSYEGTGARAARGATPEATPNFES